MKKAFHVILGVLIIGFIAYFIIRENSYTLALRNSGFHSRLWIALLTGFMI
jgi:hypothetical protein